jgi:hypothetical protein
MPTPRKNSKSSVPRLHRIIKAEIAGSGLKSGSGFQRALEGYAKYYKITGKEAEMVTAYLATTAINIARPQRGTFSFGSEPRLLDWSHVMAAVYHWKPPPNEMTQPCKEAAIQIQQMERARSKGTLGMLTPALSKHLDTFK